MTDIVEFLEARIAEDEAAARAASAGPGPWFGDSEDDSTMPPAYDERPVPGASDRHSAVSLAVSTAERQHIARHSPVRVLAECQAKRKILGNVPLVTDISAEVGGTSEYVLMCLASVYSHHPDYQEGWAIS